jgi:hypothetical protein
VAWFQVASHLGIPVDELRNRIGYSEFVEWIVYLEQLEKKHTPEHYYLAQVAAELRRTIAKDPEKVKVTDFLLQYEKQVEAPKPVTQVEGLERMRRSKSAWFAACGINPGNN